MEAGEVPRGQ